MKRKYFISLFMALILLLGSGMPYLAQEHKQKADPKLSGKFVYDGNKHYVNQQYEDARNNYQKALESNPQNSKAAYNLGNALYQLKEWDLASTSYRNALEASSISKDLKAKTYHNLGNIFMEQKKYKEAIEEYKQSLRLNPNSYNTKYNLAYAQKMLNNDKDKNDQDQNKDQDQDKKDNKDDKDQNDQNKDQKDKNDQQNQQQTPPQNSKMSQAQAEALLNAMNQQEKKVQERKNDQKGYQSAQGKDW